MKLKFIDLFAGTGGIRLGFEQACKELGINSECVLSSEIDKQACKTYQLNFNEYPLGDIHDIKKIPNFDILLGGFPCQPFSYAGKQRGFGDTRGTLFYQVLRILRENKPKAFLLENVRGLTTHDQGRTFKTIVKELEDTGYGVNFVLLNSSNFGVPQNRVRIYILGLLNAKPTLTLKSDKGSSDSHKFKAMMALPLLQKNNYKVVKDILEDIVPEKYYCTDKFTKSLKKVVGSDMSKLAGTRLIDYRNGQSIHSWQLGLKGECSNEEIEFMNALVKNRRRKEFGEQQDGKRLSVEQIKTFFDKPNLKSILKSLEKKRYIKSVDGKYNPVAGNMSFEVFKFLDPESISITLVSSDAHKLGVVVNGRPRRITPREAARIQGYPDDFIVHPKDESAYHQFGNAVAVPVVKTVLLDFIKNNILNKNTKL
jgi:DNA (cytosine-5)-methyltransferase 1